MKILHTADWHLGKTLEGRSRHREQEEVIDELCDIVESEQVDVVLIAGDVYDAVNPPAASEQLFYDALARLADYGKRKVVVIAGNHDHPERIAAATPIAQRHGITLIGVPITEAVSLDVNGVELQIAALPYPSEARLNQWFTDELIEEEFQHAYQERVNYLLMRLAKRFTPESVNIVMSHLFVAGGSESDSERPIQVGGAYTIPPSLFPKTAQYVALGHLHRPQSIRLENGTARYAGSPLAYSFSEAGQAKSVCIVHAQPGEDVEIEEIYLRSGKPLVEWKATSLSQIFTWLEAGKDRNSWLNIEVSIDEMIALEDIQRIRKAHDGIIHIKPIYANENEEVVAQDRLHLPIDQLFIRFFERQTEGAVPDEALVKRFLELITEPDE